MGKIDQELQEKVQLLKFSSDEKSLGGIFFSAATAESSFRNVKGCRLSRNLDSITT